MTTAPRPIQAIYDRMTPSAASDDGACPSGAHGNADVRRSKRWRIIDAIADHQRRVETLLDCDGVDLVRRHPVARTASRSSAAPIVSAASARSPVTMTIRLTPALRSVCTARGVSRLSSSPSRRAPIVRPSTDTNTLKAERQDARLSTRTARSLGLASTVDQLVQSGTSVRRCRPFPRDRTPWFGCCGWHRATPGRALSRALPRRSQPPATSMRRLLQGGRQTQHLLRGRAGSRFDSNQTRSPTVSVPVLSNMTVWVRASASMGPPP